MGLDFESFRDYVSQYVVGHEKEIKLIYTGLVASWESGTVPAFLLRGPPGLGKTMITEVIAGYFNAEYVFIQATLNTTEDELIYKFLPSEQTKSGIRVQYGPLPDALRRSRERTTVLTIDEFDKTRPSADALLLDFLQNARISFRIDVQEDVIVGDKRNLIVFLTSNDNREFSEPLLRRLIVINFKPPLPKEVEKLLRKHFDDDRIVRTLISIYVAGLSAKLTKPVTVQELIQLGYAMLSVPDADFNQLLLSFVVKNVHDLYELQRAFLKMDLDEIDDDMEIPNIGETILKKLDDVSVGDGKRESDKETVTVKHLLSRIRLPVDKIGQVLGDNNVEKISDSVESTFNAIINTNTFAEYDEIIRTFEPEPAERPDVLGKFKVVLDDTLRLVSDKPLTLNELDRIFRRVESEAYAEDWVYLLNGYKDILELVKYYTELRFTYYTKDTIVLIDRDGERDSDPNTVLRFDRVRGQLYRVKLYVGNRNQKLGRKDHQAELVNKLYKRFQINNVANEFVENITYKYDKEIRSGKFFESDDFRKLTNFVNDVGDIIKIRVKISLHDNVKSTVNIKEKSWYDDDENCKTDFSISEEYKLDNMEYTINYSFKGLTLMVRFNRVNDIKEGNIDVTGDVNEIIKKYVGEYEILEGLKMYHEMVKEIEGYTKTICDKILEPVRRK
jgi:MoxR-like ATPase